MLFLIKQILNKTLPAPICHLGIFLPFFQNPTLTFSLTVDGNGNWFDHFGEKFRGKKCYLLESSLEAFDTESGQWKQIRTVLVGQLRVLRTEGSAKSQRSIGSGGTGCRSPWMSLREPEMK